MDFSKKKIVIKFAGKVLPYDSSKGTFKSDTGVFDIKYNWSPLVLPLEAGSHKPEVHIEGIGYAFTGKISPSIIKLTIISINLKSVQKKKSIIKILLFLIIIIKIIGLCKWRIKINS